MSRVALGGDERLWRPDIPVNALMMPTGDAPDKLRNHFSTEVSDLGVGVYPVNKLTGLIIKNATDLMMADYMMRALKESEGYELRYDPVMNKYE